MISVKTSQINFTKVVSVLVLSACLICSCNFFSQTPGPEKLEQRVKELWDAKKNKDLGKIYQFQEKAFKKSTSEDQFLKKKQLDVIDYEFQKVEVAEDGLSGKSFVKMKIKGLGGLTFEPIVSDIWLIEEGNWHLKYIPPKNLFESALPTTE